MAMMTNAAWLLLIPASFTVGWLAGRRGGEIKTGTRVTRLSNTYFRGLNYLLNEQQDKAIEIFLQIAEVDKDTVETQFALGHLFRRRGEVGVGPDENPGERDIGDERTRHGLTGSVGDPDGDHEAGLLIGCGRDQAECRGTGPRGRKLGEVGGCISDLGMHGTGRVRDGNGAHQTRLEFQEPIEILRRRGARLGCRTCAERSPDRRRGRHRQHRAADRFELPANFYRHVRGLSVEPFALCGPGIVEDRPSQRRQRREREDGHGDQREGEPDPDLAQAVASLGEFIERRTRVWWIDVHACPGGVKCQVCIWQVVVPIGIHPNGLLATGTVGDSRTNGALGHAPASVNCAPASVGCVPAALGYAPAAVGLPPSARSGPPRLAAVHAP